jgi:hypothetical protein
MGHRPTPLRRRRTRLSPEEYAEWQEAAGEFVWPETEDGEWDFLRPGREAGEWVSPGSPFRAEVDHIVGAQSRP